MLEARRVAVVFLLFAVIWSFHLSRWDLWGPDEPRYAQVAREMVRNGDYLVPHLNGRIYGEKPPMFFWSIAALSRLLDRDGRGPSPLTARLPSAIAGLGTLLFTYLIARRIFGPSTALLSTVVLFSTFQFTTSATDAHLDSSLLFWTTAAMFFFHKGYNGGSDNGRWFLPAYAAMGFGVLTKGPVAVLIPSLSVVLFLLINRDLAALRRVEALKGLAVFLVIVFLWLVPAGLSGGKEYFDYLVFTQSTGRAVKAFHHAQPFYYYVDVFLGDFLPWSLFLPFAAVYFARRKEAREGLLFPFVWFAVTFLFFSLMSGKRSLYLLPLYPAAAIMMAKFCADQLKATEGNARGPGLLFLIPCYLFFAGIFASGILIALSAGGLIGFGKLAGGFPPFLVIPAVLLGLAGFCGILLLIRRGPGKAFALAIASMIGLIVLVLALPYPLPNVNYSLKPFAAQVERRVGPDHRLKSTFSPELFNYFLDRFPIEPIPPDRLEDEIRKDRAIFVLHRTRKNKAAQEGSLSGTNSAVKILESATIGNMTYYLLGSNEEGASPGIGR